MQLQTLSRKKFGGFKKETPKHSRQLQSNDPEAVKFFRHVWERYDVLMNTKPMPICYVEYYNWAVDLVGDFDASPHDIGMMLAALPEIYAASPNPHGAGFLISAFINSGSASDYEISTHHLDFSPLNMGFANCKNLVIHGEGLSNIGVKMESGSIRLRGNAEEYVGWELRGGSIIIEGNVTANAGSSMYGGDLIIHGDFTKSFGFGMQGGTLIACGGLSSALDNPLMEAAAECMRGGEMYIMGCYPYSFDHVRSGKIYYKGRLVVDR